MTNGLERFVAPQGDPETIRRLAWRRSALRLNILLASQRESPSDELAHLLGGLERVGPEERHRTLAAPETALYVDALLDGRRPSADVAVPVLTRVGPPVLGAAFQKFSWAGTLPLDYLPLGSTVVRMPGEKIDGPELLLDGQFISLYSPTGGATIRVPARGADGILDGRSSRAAMLEVVDGWRPFSDDFDDGNMSVNLEASARGKLGGLLAEAMTLIKVALPAALEEMHDTAQYLSPIRPKDAGTSELSSFSSPALPGVIFVGVQQGDGTWIDARHLAESCIHEHLHNRLYLLDEALPLTIRTAESKSYFSPWKRTMRGIDGMLHAIYVFSRLAWFWRVVGHRIPELEHYADGCVEEQVGQLETATAGLDTDELTEPGRRVLESSVDILRALTVKA